MALGKGFLVKGPLIKKLLIKGLLVKAAWFKWHSLKYGAPALDSQPVDVLCQPVLRMPAATPAIETISAR